MSNNIIYPEKRKGVVKMNYEKIAEMVHHLVTNPKSILSQEQGLPQTELMTNEFTIIQKVFSKLEVSGNVLTIGISPQLFWG